MWKCRSEEVRKEEERKVQELQSDRVAEWQSGSVAIRKVRKRI